MEISKVNQLFETVMNEQAECIERCSTGIGNYVFIISTVSSKYILRCSEEKNAYSETIHWLTELQACDIPIPKIISQGKYEKYEYIILTFAAGNDIGDIYTGLTDGEKSKSQRKLYLSKRKFPS